MTVDPAFFYLSTKLGSSTILQRAFDCTPCDAIHRVIGQATVA